MPDASPPDDNPYQSPLAEAEVGDRVLYYGLTEPICLNGTKTVEHLVLAYQILGGRPRGWFAMGWRMVVLLLFLVFLGAQALMMNSLTTTAFVVLLAGISVASVLYQGIIAPLELRRRLERIVGQGQAEQVCFSEEAIRFTNEYSMGEHRWERFASYREEEGLLLLQLQDFPEALVVPREYCESDSRWHTLLELVHCKVPVWKKGQQSAPRKLAHQPVEAALLEEELVEADGGPSVIATGRLTPREVRRAVRAANPWAWQSALSWSVVIVLIGYLVVVSNRDDPFGMIFPFAVALVVLAARNIAPRLAQASAYRAHRGPYAPQRWVIDANQFRLTSPYTRQRLTWDAFTRTIPRSNLLVLQLKNKSVHLFPRRFFASDDDWHRLQTLAKQHVSYGPKQTSVPSSQAT